VTAPTLSPAARRIVTWLGETGSRWGLPAIACRVHGLLYLIARPLSAAAIAEALALDNAETAQALDWLRTQDLVGMTDAGWTTGIDPWALMIQTLEKRRALELSEARAVIDQWRAECEDEDPVVKQQAKRLFDLVDDIAAIDARVSNLSPVATRQLISLGGRAARLFDRTIGRGRR
jgi:DNA-binding transcriptional regulator GbsR (MarR family)